MKAKFEDYRHEFQNERIEAYNYPLVCEVALAVCPKYPPELYSPESIWNEDTIRQLVDQFFVEVLLKQDRLKYHYLTQETVDGLRNVISNDFRNFLRNQKLRTEAINIYKRVLLGLSDKSQFELIQEHSRPSARIYSLSGSNHEVNQTCQDLEDVIRAMFSVKIPPIVRYRADSSKYSHLISSDNLMRLLKKSFNILDKPINVGMLINAIRYRLNILEISTVSLEDTITYEGNNSLAFIDIVPDGKSNAETEYMASESANNIFERLSNRQRKIFTLWAADYTLVEIGDFVGVSKSTVHDELRKLHQEISKEQPTVEETEIISDQLSMLCNHFYTNTNGNA